LKQDFIKRLETFDETIRRLGMVPSTKLLELKVVQNPPSEVTEILKLSEGQSCIYLFRVRYADHEPNVHVKTWLPYEQCQFITQHDLEKDSLYRILSTHDDTSIAHINRVMEALPATTEDAKILGIAAGEPVHFFTSIGYNKQEEPIEYSQARYRGDRNRFEVDLYYSEADHH
jgi:GntR family transcriptional regulator